MRKCLYPRVLALVLVLMISFVFPRQLLAGHGEKAPMKKAVLLVAFGTSIPEAQHVYENIDKMAREAFPNVEIRWAYTSKIIRKKLAKRGKILDSPELALARLMEDDYTHVAVLSLHFIPGEEFHNLYVNAHLFGQMEGGFQKLLVARPLLSSYEDMERVADAVIKHFPNSRKKNEAVVLMGHGNEKHPADAIYMAMASVFQKKDPLVFLATVEGHPTIDDVIPELKAKKVKKVYLMPFMSVAGDHARNDMAGDEKDSWKSILESQGFKCEAVLTGMAAYPEIVNVWLDHLKSVLKHFE